MVLQGSITSFPSSSTLPALLCLHGGGSNSTIFNVQTIRLQRALSSTFQFMFIDGPFPSSPGPGILPWFDGCDPFYVWSEANTDGLPEETRRVVEKAREEEKGRLVEFVGVLGFSQGAKVAGGLLLEQQLLAGKTGQPGKKFKFGVLCNGVSPPLVSSRFSEEEKRELIKVPTVHVIGLEDPVRYESRKLFECCEEGSRALIELEIGHRLPNLESETDMVAEEILRLYRSTCGVSEKGEDEVRK